MTVENKPGHAPGRIKVPTDADLVGFVSLVLGSAEKCASPSRLAHRILDHATSLTGCELATLRLGRIDDPERYRAALSRDGEYDFRNIGPGSAPATAESRPGLVGDDFEPTGVTLIHPGKEGAGQVPPDRTGRTIGAIIALPFDHDHKTAGLLALGFDATDSPSPETMRRYAHLAAFVGRTISNWYALADLRERVKELSCLHGLTRLLESPDRSTAEVLQGVVELLPGAWLYAGQASAALEYEGREFVSRNHRTPVQRQTAALKVKGLRVGRVEVSYAVRKPDLDEGPFLAEERRLLDNVAGQVSQFLERRLYESETAEMMDKLRHADRLAMVGHLSATLAHEINEPLTTILGYAQLAAKSPDLPPRIAGDIGKVVATSLHVREIIRKTLLYSGKIPPRVSRVDLNAAVDEVLELFEWRCRKERISAEFHPSTETPELNADPGQVRQVITNLMVNAIQAMPRGGRLTLETGGDSQNLWFSVADTGRGMTKEVVGRMFIPFFSTKEPGRGTGLGLSVVHDIVTEQGGEIKVMSEPEKGTEIVVVFPRKALKEEQRTGDDVGD